MRKFSASLLIFAGCLCLTGSAYFYYLNYMVEKQGQEHCASISQAFHSTVTSTEQIYSPTLLQEEEVEFQVVAVPIRNETILIDGSLYIGLLEIPQLGLSLPIHMDLTEQNLSTAPCVYAGSLAEQDLVIAGHNYRSHFWYFRDLNAGAEMTITDPNGKVYRYKVDSKVILHQSETAVLMDREDWDLTLYTCQYPDNNYRIVLRCNRV